MPRPNFPFPGYWLGVNGQIQVHMGPHGIDNAHMYYLGTGHNAATDQSGVVDHIAFLATEPGEFIRRFKTIGVDYRPRALPESDLYQIFVTDPNGLTIELNFFGLEGGHGLGRRGLQRHAPPGHVGGLRRRRDVQNHVEDADALTGLAQPSVHG